MQDVYIYLENGLYFKAKSFATNTTEIGELVFNTSMTGYQEIATDPSYAGQFVLFSSPEIGIVGINPDDMESDKVYAKGVLVCNYTDNYSNFRATDSLSSLLKQNKKMGICDIDTRELVKILRKNGSMEMIASTEIEDIDKLKNLLNSATKIKDINYIKTVSTTKKYTHKYGAWNHIDKSYNKIKSTDKKILVIDFGVKRNILNELAQTGLDVEVVPYDFDVDEIVNRYNNCEIDGVFLSNGPGDPMVLTDEIKKVSKLVDANITIFGICLGHQILSIANGFNTYKLKFGHHGANHPAYNTNNKSVEITSQNHNYNVPDDIAKIANIVYTNLFDGTIEGLEYKNKDIFSVQFHPESSPGPHDSKYIFSIFKDKMTK